MKRIAIVLFIAMFVCTAAFGQKLTVVVGAAGGDASPGLRKSLETQVKQAFVKDGRIIAVTRDEAALAMVEAEHIYQREGAVDDNQIRQLGKQLGARYVCVLEISSLMESYMLSAQFVDIESARIVSVASVPSSLKNRADFLAASEELVKRVLDPKTQGAYGSGLYFEDGKSASPLYRKLAGILRQKVPLSDGTCIGGSIATIETPPEPECAESMVGTVCRADVSLVITQCKSGEKTVLRGSVVGSDKQDPAAARKKFERNISAAKFWDEWVKELEKREKR